MKNILAENMMRFGSKNLTQENRKNLKRLTEGEPIIEPHYKHSLSGIIYRVPFKDKTQFITFTTTPKLGDIVTTSTSQTKINPNITSLMNDYYYYASAILKKVALAGKYTSANYETPQIFLDYLFNTDDEATNNTNDYDNIQCGSGGNGQFKTFNEVSTLLQDSIDDMNRVIALAKKNPVPGQSPEVSSKFLSGWNKMLITLNSQIPTRLNIVNSDPGTAWNAPGNFITLNS